MRGGDAETHRGGRRRRCRRQAQQEDGPAGGACPALQAPGRRQVEACRVAADFDDDGGKRGKAGRLAGDPQRVERPSRAGKQQRMVGNAEQRLDGRRMGKAGLAGQIGRAHPQ